jgi:BirA family biotin operon repressor/biotin-[acetyl-CoA-carboxylase] ligase
LIAAIAASQAIEAVCGAVPLLKWPNDVMLSQRKVCGVLVEARSVGTRIFLVAGIGINVHHRPEDFLPEVRRRAASIEGESGAAVDRSLLFARLLLEMEELLEREAHCDLDLCAHWEKRDFFSGREVTVDAQGLGALSGRAGGIEPDGRFRILDRDGRVTHLRSGEASLKDADAAGH